jgi:GT2 family glycosyltransferase
MARGLVSLLVLWLTACCSILAQVPTVYVVLSVKTRYEVVKECVDSLILQKPPKQILSQKVIFVDDGSPPQTIAYQQELCALKTREYYCLETQGESRGYTHAINKGIQLGLSLGNHSKDAILLLNSDVVVTFGWLQKLYSSLYSSERLMLVGPMSNAATYQSLPQMRNGDGSWATNPLPSGLSIDYLAYVLSIVPTSSVTTSVDLTILNGFCYLLKISVFQRVGLFDNVTFPSGYGEEVDYSLRVHKAGYGARFIPSVYLFHRKTASFQITSRNTLKERANKLLEKKYAKELAGFSKSALESRKQVKSLVNRIEALYADYRRQYALPVTLKFRATAMKRVYNRISPQLTTTGALASVSSALAARRADPLPPPGPASPYRVLYLMGLSPSEYLTRTKWRSPLLRLLTSLKESGISISILDRPLLFEDRSQAPSLSLGQFHSNGIPQLHHTSIKPETLNSMLVTLPADLFSLAYLNETATPPPRNSSSSLLSAAIQKLKAHDIIASDSCSAILLVKRLLSVIRQMGGMEGRASRQPSLVLYSRHVTGVNETETPLGMCYESLMNATYQQSPYLVYDDEWSASQVKQLYQRVLPPERLKALQSQLVTIPSPVDRLKYHWDQSQMFSRRGTRSSSALSHLLSGGIISPSATATPAPPYRALINLHHPGTMQNIAFVTDLIIRLLQTTQRRLSLTVIGSKSLLLDAYDAQVPQGLSPNISLLLTGNKYIDFIDTPPQSRAARLTDAISIKASSLSSAVDSTASSLSSFEDEQVAGWAELLRRHDLLMDLSLSRPSSGQYLDEVIASGCIAIVPLGDQQQQREGERVTLSFDTTDAKRYHASLMSLLGLAPPLTQQGSAPAPSRVLSPDLIPQLVLEGYKYSVALSIELAAATLSVRLAEISRKGQSLQRHRHRHRA